jgi:hypothetical protein
MCTRAICPVSKKSPTQILQSKNYFCTLASAGADLSRSDAFGEIRASAKIKTDKNETEQ